MWTIALDVSLLQVALCTGTADASQGESLAVPRSKMSSSSCWELGKGLSLAGVHPPQAQIPGWLAIIVTKRKSVCLIHRPNNAETSQFGAERFIVGPGKETGGSCLKKAKLLKSYQQSPFKGKVREGCG